MIVFSESRCLVNDTGTILVSYVRVGDDSEGLVLELLIVSYARA